MSTLYRCDTCGKLLRHCAPHSREIAPPVVLRGVPTFHDERTWCSGLCYIKWAQSELSKYADMVCSEDPVEGYVTTLHYPDRTSKPMVLHVKANAGTTP